MMTNKGKTLVIHDWEFVLGGSAPFKVEHYFKPDSKAWLKVRKIWFIEVFTWTTWEDASVFYAKRELPSWSKSWDIKISTWKIPDEDFELGIDETEDIALKRINSKIQNRGYSTIGYF